MCTRFYVLPGTPDLEYIMEAAGRSPLLRRFVRLRQKEILKTSGEIRPTDIVSVLAPDRSGNAAVYPMQWGFRLPPRGKAAGTDSAKGMLLVNARSETASEKAAFRDAWASRRCIIPASWYFEWEHYTDEKGRRKTGQKYAIGVKSASESETASEEAFLRAESPLAGKVLQASSVTWLCGLYRIENNVPVFVVLTREPGQELARIHDRMPLILPPEAALEWILPQTRPESLLQYALTDMEIRAAY